MFRRERERVVKKGVNEKITKVSYQIQSNVHDIPSNRMTLKLLPLSRHRDMLLALAPQTELEEEETNRTRPVQRNS